MLFGRGARLSVQATQDVAEQEVGGRTSRRKDPETNATAAPSWHAHREPAERQQVDSNGDAADVEGHQRPSDADDHRPDPVPDEEAANACPSS